MYSRHKFNWLILSKFFFNLFLCDNPFPKIPCQTLWEECEKGPPYVQHWPTFTKNEALKSRLLTFVLWIISSDETHVHFLLHCAMAWGFGIAYFIYMPKIGFAIHLLNFVYSNIWWLLIPGSQEDLIATSYVCNRTCFSIERNAILKDQSSPIKVLWID